MPIVSEASTPPQKIVPIKTTVLKSTASQLTDINMEDLQLMLEFKHRAVQKIRNLEEVIRNQKDDQRFFDQRKPLNKKQSSVKVKNPYINNNEANHYYNINSLINPKEQTYTEIMNNSDIMSNSMIRSSPQS